MEDDDAEDGATFQNIDDDIPSQPQDGDQTTNNSLGGKGPNLEFMRHIRGIKANTEKSYWLEFLEIINVRWDGRVPKFTWPAVADVYRQKFGHGTAKMCQNKLNGLKKKMKPQGQQTSQVGRAFPTTTNDTAHINTPPDGSTTADNITATDIQDTNTQVINTQDTNTQVTNTQDNMIDHNQDDLNSQIVVDNVPLFINCKTKLEENYNRFVALRDSHARTPPVMKKHENHQLLNYLNEIITREGYPERLTTIERLNNFLYAIQVTYIQLTKRPEHKNDWRKQMNEKIEKYRAELDQLKQHDKGRAPSKSVKDICKKYRVHTRDCNFDKLVGDIEEKLAKAMKQVRMTDIRRDRNAADRAFEHKRSAFYRAIDGDTKKISEDIDVQEVKSFWSSLWHHKELPTDKWEPVLDHIHPADLIPNADTERVKTMVKEIISYAPAWKATGNDFVHMWTIKKMKALHDKIADLIATATQDPEMIDESLYTGLTYLLPKVENATKAEELRPITCLPMIYKLASKVIARQLSEFCQMNEVISANQLGIRSGTQGAKEQYLINKALHQRNRDNLDVTWMDVRKAYDHVDHKCLLELLTRLNVPLNILNFVRRMTLNQRTSLMLNGKEIGRAKIERGILQGDAMSPILFVMYLEPVSRVLNGSDIAPISSGPIHRNHLIFIDDIKILTSTGEDHRRLCKLAKKTLKKIGMKLNMSKCATTLRDGEMVGETLTDAKTYRYLGILEGADGTDDETNKKIIVEKLFNRVEKILSTQLNAKYTINAINEWALTTINYVTGILDWSKEETERMDQDIRKLLYKCEAARHTCNPERLYLPRNEFGRGLGSITDRVEAALLKLQLHLQRTPVGRELLASQESQCTQLANITQRLEETYGSADPSSLKKNQLCIKRNKINTKNMHKLQFDDCGGIIDVPTSNLWLKHTKLSAREEGTLTKLQDRNIYFMDQKCKRCVDAKASVDHFATCCPTLADKDYKIRHDEVARFVHHRIQSSHGLKPKHLRNYRAESTINAGHVSIKYDVPINTNANIQHYRPDILVMNRHTKKIQIIEIGITSASRLNEVETTKWRKYERLAAELRTMYPGYQTECTPIVLTWDGRVTKHFRRHASKIGLTAEDIAYIQLVALRQTMNIIGVDIYYEWNTPSQPPEQDSSSD